MVAWLSTVFCSVAVPIDARRIVDLSIRGLGLYPLEMMLKGGCLGRPAQGNQCVRAAQEAHI
jgi:hypothetical protein